MNKASKYLLVLVYSYTYKHSAVEKESVMNNSEASFIHPLFTGASGDFLILHRISPTHIIYSQVPSVCWRQV